MDGEILVAGATVVARELSLFAVVGFLIGGIDDVIIDVIWIARAVWRRFVIYRRYDRATINSLEIAEHPGLIAVFVPAWDEAAVITPMLRHAASAWVGRDVRIMVGAYPNDAATIAAVHVAAHPAIQLVIGSRPGPTTKADCLNTLWRAMCAEEERSGVPFKAVVLHDAEDVVHAGEIGIYDRLIERFDLVQLPVVPFVDPASRWVAGHYIDEFAESHGKTLVVREAIGARIPAAGVGCAFSREMLGRISDARNDDGPFDADSLTEDYELGLRLTELRARGVFVRLPDAKGKIVAVRAHFPATLDAAVRQKSRWIAGIALSGWDRLGWHGGFAERWMRLHDRRALVAATLLLAAYAALVLTFALWLIEKAGGPPRVPMGSLIDQLLFMSGVFLVWRLAMRFMFVSRSYGFIEGIRAIPRVIVANIIALMAARRAVGLYRRMRRDGIVRWDKTEHHFPADIPAR